MDRIDLPRAPPAARNALLGSLLRYGITGAGLALPFSLVYEAVLHFSPGSPQLANALAFMVTTVLGYLIHSSWSFRGHATGTVALAGMGKFLIVNLCSFALNGFWVWLIVQHWQFPAHAALVPILGMTPWLSFVFNRYWAFAPA